MLKHFNQPGIRVCVSSHPQTLIYTIREKSKFQGKKQKHYDTVHWEHQNVPLQPHEDFEPNEWLPRRLTYLPENLWCYRVPRPKPAWWFDKYKPMEIKTLDPPEKEWNEVAVYPKIVKDPEINNPYLSTYLRRTAWYKELAELPSIDEKNHALTQITRNCLHFSYPFFMNYGCGVEMAQSLTRTHLIDGKLPESYSTDGIDETLVNRLTPLLLDAIRVNRYESGRSKTFRITLGSECMADQWENRITENNLLQEINNLVSNVLISNCPHLVDLQVDLESRIRSWWYASQLPVTKAMKRKHTLWRYKGYEKIDQVCSYDSVTPLCIRSSSPLSRIVSGTDDLSSTGEIPEIKFHPERYLGGLKGRYLPTIPGFLPPANFDPSTRELDDFPFLSMFGRWDHGIRRKLNFDQDFGDDDDVAKCKAILGSFNWLNSLSFYHGFTPFHEITYPFVNQGLVTDGQKWHFFVYQLNAHTFHSDLFDGDGPRNLCWISPEIKLYDSYQDGQFTGVNKDIAKLLIKMYSKVPVKEENIAYRPHIGKDNRSLEEIEQMRRNLSMRSNNKHSKYMNSYKYARLSQLYHKLFVDNPDYESTMMRIALRPRLKPAEPYYHQWKY